MLYEYEYICSFRILVQSIQIQIQIHLNKWNDGKDAIVLRISTHTQIAYCIRIFRKWI
jgi:hypothetical protein